MKGVSQQSFMNITNQMNAAVFDWHKTKPVKQVYLEGNSSRWTPATGLKKV